MFVFFGIEIVDGLPSTLACYSKFKPKSFLLSLLPKGHSLLQTKCLLDHLTASDIHSPDTFQTSELAFHAVIGHVCEGGKVRF